MINSVLPFNTFERLVVVVSERAATTWRPRIAGAGPSTAQRMLLRFGSAMPALPGLTPPAEIRMWCYYNTAVFCCCLCFPPFAPLLLLMGRLPRIMQQCCPRLGNECQLALSGQRVLKVMMNEPEVRRFHRRRCPPTPPPPALPPAPPRPLHRPSHLN